MYFDYKSEHICYSEVMDVVVRGYEKVGNSSSVHTSGRLMHYRAVECARKQLAASIDADSKILFYLWVERSRTILL